MSDPATAQNPTDAAGGQASPGGPANPENSGAGADASQTTGFDAGEGKAAGGAQETERSGQDDARDGDDTVPENYHFDLPDGFDELDEGFAAEVTPVLKDLALTNREANKLVPLYAAQVKKMEQRAANAWNDRLEGWKNEVMADRELGGDKLPATTTAAAKAIVAFSPNTGEAQALREVLESSGLGNHPAVIRFFSRVGKAVSEDMLHRSDSTGGQRSLADRIYGQQQR